jgi:glyoxylase-like metal-dependent hydrolase (beta-lactamase superfamily II)
MKIADNVEILEIADERGALYPVLVWDNDHLVLIDTALPGQIELLNEAASIAGLSVEKITDVIITHHDMDHIGCAKTIAGFGAKIYAHEIEAPFIQGDKTSLRIVDMENRFSELSEGERAFYEQVKKGAPNFYVHVDHMLNDGEILDFCGGIQIIHTPGHTPGHIALLLNQSNCLVTGDAANIADGALAGANPYYTYDMAEAEKSFTKMLSFSPSSVICYHGGYLTLG